MKRPLAYITAPWGANEFENTEDAAKYCRKVYDAGYTPMLIAMGDPDIDVNEVVFHSIRHTSAGVKLRLSKGDLKAVQGDGGWNTPDMVTKRYAHILDEDRRNLATEMEAAFYQGGGSIKPTLAPEVQAPASLDANALASILSANPDLLIQVLQSVQSANRS